jgi:hypothetical protein
MIVREKVVQLFVHIYALKIASGKDTYMETECSMTPNVLSLQRVLVTNFLALIMKPCYSKLFIQSSYLVCYVDDFFLSSIYIVKLDMQHNSETKSKFIPSSRYNAKPHIVRFPFFGSPQGLCPPKLDVSRKRKNKAV